jgi:hypothetical protein
MTRPRKYIPNIFNNVNTHLMKVSGFLAHVRSRVGNIVARFFRSTFGELVAVIVLSLVAAFFGSLFVAVFIKIVKFAWGLV